MFLDKEEEEHVTGYVNHLTRSWAKWMLIWAVVYGAYYASTPDRLEIELISTALHFSKDGIQDN
jgi:hypothetical protein